MGKFCGGFIWTIHFPTCTVWYACSAANVFSPVAKRHPISMLKLYQLVLISVGVCSWLSIYVACYVLCCQNWTDLQVCRFLTVSYRPLYVAFYICLFICLTFYLGLIEAVASHKPGLSSFFRFFHFLSISFKLFRVLSFFVYFFRVLSSSFEFFKVL